MGWHRFVRRARWDAERQRELESYLQIETDDNIARGMAPPEARAAAVRKLGNRTRIREQIYHANTIAALDALARDVRYGLRILLHHPTFAITAALTLAIGIGANTAVFAVLNSVLLKPLAYPDSERLVAVWNTAPGAPGLTDVSGGLRLSASMYVTFAEENRVFARIGVWTTGTAAVTGIAAPEQVRTALVTDGTLQAFAVAPRAGRWLSTEDQIPNAQPVAMLTYGYWQRRFGGAPDVIGRTLTVDNIARRVVGVMPRGFTIADTPVDVILPIIVDRSRLIRPGFAFFGIARLKPGVTIAAANADVARMLPIWLHRWPGGTTEGYQRWRIAPALRPLKDDVVGPASTRLWLVMGTIAIVFLIACANVTNLLLVRAESRRPEVAVRAALGAGSWRLIRERLLESVLLSTVGGIIGLGIAGVTLSALIAVGPSGLPRLAEVTLDARALGFIVVVSALAGLLLGVAPAIQIPTRRIALSLQGGTRGGSAGAQRHRAQNALVVVQVALAVVLLVSSGLMLRTFQSLRAVDPGFKAPEQLQIMRIAIPPSLVADDDRALRLQRDILDQLSAIPDVVAAAWVTTMPLDGIVGNWDSIAVEGRPTVPGEGTLRRFKYASPGLFRTAGMRLVAGRDFTWDETAAHRRVVVLSENVARELWGTPSAALGQHIRQGTGPRWEVVGVVNNVHDNGVDAPAPGIVYWPPAVENTNGVVNLARIATFVVRCRRAGTETFLRDVERAVWSVNHSLPVAAPQTMEDLYERSLSRTGFTMVMLALAGGMALVLGVIGIYGVLAYVVTQRRHEIGIRLALGEPHRDVQRRFVRHGLTLTGGGLAVGVLAATAVARLMTGVLFEVSPLDPLTYLAVVLVLTAAAAAASYVPARRASRVSPREILATS